MRPSRHHPHFHHHHHHQHQVRAGAWYRRAVLLGALCFGGAYVTFFITSSRRALSSGAHQPGPLHRQQPQAGVGAIQLSLAAQQVQQQVRQQIKEGMLPPEPVEKAEKSVPASRPEKQQPEQEPPPAAEPKQKGGAQREAKEQPTETARIEAPQPQPAAQAAHAAAVTAAGTKMIPADKGALKCKKKSYKQGDPGSVVYWRDWTEETPMWTSPYAEEARDKYVTFEPDEGGFNNIRMALETFFAFALATGRTLVVPDEYGMYLLGKKGLQHDFADFYDLGPVQKHVKVIEMDEFLEKEGLTGRLKDGELPPGNATTFERKRPLWEYIRRAADVFPVGPNTHVVGFDFDGDEEAVTADPGFAAFASGRQLLVYGPELREKKVLHFTSMMDGGHRYLIHFYAFLFFRDRKADNFVKRFVRDLLHYKAEIFCHAAQVVDLLHADSGGSLEYDAIHIRRGDFQFKNTRLDVETIFKNVEDIIEPGALVYVLTDEHNATFFDPVRGRYRLRFLKDYYLPAGLDEMNPNWSGMLEQVVASGARRFVGTFFSTLTGYATRLRGYLGKNPGWYFLPEHKDELQDPAKHYASPPFYLREFPAAYAGIDSE